jgi:sensor histidine kinase YesM
MHPLLSGRRGIAYALAWTPVLAMQALFLWRAGDLQLGEAAAMALGLSLVYSMICLSAWYLCRQIPFAVGTGVRLGAATVAASLAASGIWILTSRLLAAGLAETTNWTGLEVRMARNENWLFATGVLVYLLAVTFNYLVVEADRRAEMKNREVQAAVMAREAELKALREQVRPHFLFNSLHSISALVSLDPERARQMCVDLADFLRVSLKIGDRRFIPLAEELVLARHYLAIERVRFEERMRIEEQISETVPAILVPPLVLQPLVENAVKHGIAQLVDGGVIGLDVRERDNEVIISITNSVDAEAAPRRGAGLGLANVRRRLATIYGGGARLDTRLENGQFRAELRILKQPPEVLSQ